MSILFNKNLTASALLLALGLAFFVPSQHAVAGLCGCKDKMEQNATSKRKTSARSKRKVKPLYMTAYSAESDSEPPTTQALREEGGSENTEAHTDLIRKSPEVPQEREIEQLDGYKLQEIKHFIQTLDQGRGEGEVKVAPIVRKILRNLPEEARYPFVLLFKDCAQVQSESLTVMPFMQKVAQKGKDFILLMREVSSHLPTGTVSATSLNVIELDNLTFLFALLKPYPARRYAEIRDTVKLSFIIKRMAKHKNKGRKLQSVKKQEEIVGMLNANPTKLFMQILKLLDKTLKPAIQKQVNYLDNPTTKEFSLLFRSCKEIFSDTRSVLPLMKKVAGKGNHFIRFMRKVSTHLPTEEIEVISGTFIQLFELEHLERLFKSLQAYPEERYGTILKATTEILYSRRKDRAENYEELIEVLSFADQESQSQLNGSGVL